MHSLNKISRFSITTAYLILTVIGLFMYLIVLCALVIKRNQFKNPFYRFATALGAVDVLVLLTELVYCIPIGYGIVQFSKNYENFLGFVVPWAFFACSTLIAIISFNRFIGVCAFKYYQLIFSDKNVRLMVAGALLYGLFQALMPHYCGQNYKFVEISWIAFTVNNSSCLTVGQSMNFYHSVVCVTTICVFYAATILGFKSARTRAQGAQEAEQNFTLEARLMIQFAIIVLFLLFFMSTYWILFVILFKHPPLFLLVLNNFSWILNSANNPILYICFSSEIRNAIGIRFRTLRNTKEVSLVSLQQSNDNAEDVNELKKTAIEAELHTKTSII